MKKTITNALRPILGEDFVLEKPKDVNLGHYATPIAFTLAKSLKKSPIAIADEFKEKLQNIDIFEDVSSIKGYLNFKLSKQFLDDFSKKDLKSTEKKESILVEYVSANPTGPLHIGHARGAVVGDSLCRIGLHLGYQITSEYYINDAGNQIELLGLSIFLSGKENILKQAVKWPEEYYRGDYIDDLALIAKDELGISIFEDEKTIKTLSVWGKDKMLERIKSDLSSAGIIFDNFVSEKKIQENLMTSLEKIKKNGKAYEKDGKLWISSSELKDEKDRVVIREDNRPTYFAGDIAYHDEKFSRNYDRYINIWGADHHGYIARVEAAINFLGYDENKLETILTQMVSLLKNGEPFKMSKRAGTFILMSDIVEEIGKDALRFIFLSKKCDTHLDFDLDILKQQDSSNPIFYINYAHARINQLFAKANKSFDDVKNASLEPLGDDGVNLLFNALLINEVLEDAFSSRQMQKVTDYLKFLASLLHKFYNDHKIVGSENEDAYLKLFMIVKRSIHKGLELIGIDAKDIM